MLFCEPGNTPGSFIYPFLRVARGVHFYLDSLKVRAYNARS